MTKIIVLAVGFAISTPTVPTFGDVPRDNPFFAFIETAVARGIVSGYQDSTFRPYNDVTRGQLAKIVVTATDWSLADPTTPTFLDVNRDNPFFGFIETAAAHGAISGYSDQTFRWGANATRGQIVKIVFAATAAGASVK